MPDTKVLALVGSLRAASINRQIAELAAEVAQDGVAVTIFEGLGDLPFYNEETIDNERRRRRLPSPRFGPPPPMRMPPWLSPRNTTGVTRP